MSWHHLYKHCRKRKLVAERKNQLQKHQKKQVQATKQTSNVLKLVGTEDISMKKRGETHMFINTISETARANRALCFSNAVSS